MSALKDLYSKPFYDSFAIVLKQTIPSFDKKEFEKKIFTSEFQNYELKARMAHTAKVLHDFLPADFDKAAKVLVELVKNIQQSEMARKSFECMFLPEYVAMYGLNHYDSAVMAMEAITQFTSCEFAVRPFIIKYEDKMIGQMLAWSKHSSRQVRRLASEGSRPRLPWAMGLPKLKKDPAPILPILENLKQDTCEVVRRSVANSLNDISKDNPKIVLDIAKKWKGLGKEVDAIIKHASRTLLKGGHAEILEHFELNSADCQVDNFKIITPTVKIGEHLECSFSVTNTGKSPLHLRLEYAIYFRKNNGLLSKKVFKISERTLQAKECLPFVKKHSFRVITTRKFYLGGHEVSVITNGKEHGLLGFELV